MAEFLGRPHELDVVRSTLARARRERRPTAVVVDGEPGVGKTRLVDEVSRGAGGPGSRSARGSRKRPCPSPSAMT
jgi:predicted ATPase